jgi:hypothetical protein
VAAQEKEDEVAWGLGACQRSTESGETKGAEPGASCVFSATLHDNARHASMPGVASFGFFRTAVAYCSAVTA